MELFGWLVAGLIISAVSATASLGVGIGNAVNSKKVSEENAKAQAAANEQNMAIYQMEREDAHHALEIAVEDAKNAGLNPASVAGTSGATVASGPTMQAVQKSPIDFSGIQQGLGAIQDSFGVNNMLDVGRKLQEHRMVQAQIQGQNINNAFNAATYNDRLAEKQQQVELLRAQIANTKDENLLTVLRSDLQRAENEYFGMYKMKPATAEPLIISGSGHGRFGTKRNYVEGDVSVSGTPLISGGDGSDDIVKDVENFSKEAKKSIFSNREVKTPKSLPTNVSEMPLYQ